MSDYLKTNYRRRFLGPQINLIFFKLVAELSFIPGPES